MIPWSMDRSLEHYMEERALAIALAMASTPESQARIDHLATLRAALMEHRRVQLSSGGHAPTLSREEMDAHVKRLYMEQGTPEDVLRVHARSHFALVPAHEESFARAWIDAVGDPSFTAHMRALQATTTTTIDPKTSSSPPRTDDRNP